MQLGMIGLGRMGGNMTERCLQHGHDMVVYDQNAEVVARYVAKGAGGVAAEEGDVHCGPPGAGHFVKMIHS